MFTRNIKVLPSDSSSFGTIKLKNLLDYFQDTAGMAVDDIEGTATELNARGYSWVLTRYEIEFLGRLPTLDEKFSINTYHDPSHGYNTLRIFDVQSEKGNQTAWAKTSWLLLDLAVGRPVKPAAHIPEILTRDTSEINPDFQDIPKIEENNIIKSVEFPVKFHDLDYNSHVNNAVYFSWVHDESPINFNEYELKTVCAAFRTGAKFGEKVKLNFSQINSDENNENEGKIFLCEIYRENVKKPSANFLCYWRKKECEKI